MKEEQGVGTARRGKGRSRSEKARVDREGTEKKRNRRAKGIARRGNSKAKEEKGLATARREKAQTDQERHGLIGKEQRRKEIEG